jgi:hypothetical protein
VNQAHSILFGSQEPEQSFNLLAFQLFPESIWAIHSEMPHSPPCSLLPHSLQLPPPFACTSEQDSSVVADSLLKTLSTLS